jgi:tRNA (guanine-N7-)-methyltransferase
VVIRPGELTCPLDIEAVFSRPGPLVVEVGFGDGRFTADLGRRNPEWNILGVEVSLGSVWRAYRRLIRESVTNVRLFRGNARMIVRDVLSERSLSRIYVNFPDPWPRLKHRKNRLLQADFFSLLSTRLGPGGSLSFTTDHGEYFNFACEEARISGHFDVLPGVPPEAALETKYALKWREQNKKIFHADFLKVSEAAPRAAINVSVPMQHAILSGSLDTVGSFNKVVHSFEGGHVIILQAFRDLEDGGLLFKVIVEEPDLMQEVLVQAWPKDDGVFISLQPFGNPLFTKGVREAVRAVACWLETQGLKTEKSWI